jgi:hypothetical protein
MTEESPSQRKTLLERLGVTSGSSTSVYRPRPVTAAGPSAQPSENTLLDLIDRSSWHSNAKRSHRKGISENLGLSSFREDTAIYDTNKLDTWEGFYNPRTNDRRSLGP